MTPELGQPVSFTHVLVRGIPYTDPKKPLRKEWQPKGVHWEVPRAESLDGIIVGVRTLGDGEFRSVGYGGPFDEPEEAFVCDHHFTAYLIAYDLRRKPVYVLPEHTNLDQKALA